MAKQLSLVLRPSRGCSGSLSPSDPSHAERLDDGSFRVCDVYDHQNAAFTGCNYAYGEDPGTLHKCQGDALLIAGIFGTATGGYIQNIGMLDDGTNQDMWAVSGGKFYTIDVSAGTCTNVDAAAPVTFNTQSPLSTVQYGSYVALAQSNTAAITPYKWTHAGANLTKLILAGTEFKFKFLEEFHNHIVGAYSDQTNGHLDIRWTDALPAMDSLSFPAANQLYKPDNDYGITGLKRMGDKALLLYGKESVSSLVYTADYTPVFSVDLMATGVGTESHASIVDMGDAHYFFDPTQGIIRYKGGSTYDVISGPIEWLLNGTKPSQYKFIWGSYDVVTRELVWGLFNNAVALAPTTTNVLAYYHPKLNRWRVEQRSATAFYSGEQYSKESTARINRSVFGTATRYIYRIGKAPKVLQQLENLTSMATASFLMTYNMPIFGFPDVKRHKRFLEVHLFSTEIWATPGSVQIDWRGGDTEQAVNGSSWATLGSVSQTTTASDILYCDVTAKLHQFRISNSSSTDIPSVNKIELVGYIY